MTERFDIFVHNFGDPSRLELLKEGIWATSTGSRVKESFFKVARGYLGLELTKAEAQEILRATRDPFHNRLEARHTKYREGARISVLEASKCASNFLELKKLQGKNAEQTWDENVSFYGECDLRWTFALGSPSLQSQGATPGAIFASVDKVDGHIWTDDEFIFYEVLNDG